VLLQTTKSQRRKIAKAFRERDIVFLIQAGLFHLRLSHLFSFTRGEYKMRVFYTPFAFWLWSERARERSDEFFYRRFLREGDTVVDVGANIGLCTLLSAHIVGAEGKVYSFEPHPRTFSQLQKNVALNRCSHVNLYQIGASNEYENILFTDEYVSDINHVDRAGSISVILKPIDHSLPKECSAVTLLKIDVEGYELFALKGAEDTLTKTRVIYFESAPRSFERYGYTLKDIFVYLCAQGFVIYKTDQELELIPVALEYQTLSGYENVIAVRAVDTVWLQDRLKENK
jgi:FkbM family methyltransferase